MLPFLKNQMKQGSGVIVKQRESDSQEEIAPDSLEDCVERLIMAFASKDKSKIVEALRDVHDELHLEMKEKSESNQADESADKE